MSKIKVSAGLCSPWRPPGGCFLPLPVAPGGCRPASLARSSIDHASLCHGLLSVCLCPHFPLLVRTVVDLGPLHSRMASHLNPRTSAETLFYKNGSTCKFWVALNPADPDQSRVRAQQS